MNFNERNSTVFFKPTHPYWIPNEWNSKSTNIKFDTHWKRDFETARVRLDQNNIINIDFTLALCDKIWLSVIGHYGLFKSAERDVFLW